jgi:hypothetical protein
MRVVVEGDNDVGIHALLLREEDDNRSLSIEGVRAGVDLGQEWRWVVPACVGRKERWARGLGR